YGHEVQAKEVSDGNNELTGSWSKGHSCYALVKSSVGLCHCPGDLQDFELESDDLVYLVEEISKQQSIHNVAWLLLAAFVHICEQRNDLKSELIFKREAEHKSLENVQPDHVVEKESSFLGEKFKQAAEICISVKEPSAVSQNTGEKASKAFQRPLQQIFPSQA
uniref:Uncharacterized protein n=1 Tax=Macaca mulatta TaxID=9544 RepID=A0A5F7ZKN9_MACMU